MSIRFYLQVIFLGLVVLLINYILLKNFFGYGLVHEDWGFLVYPKTYSDNLFVKGYKLWYFFGPNWGHQMFYFGLMDQLFPKNYELIQKINVGLKIIAAICLYPTILTLTKNKYLAFLSAFLYSVLSASAGSLTYFITGGEYLAIIFLNFFVIFYYKNIAAKKFRFLILAWLFLWLASFSALIRIVGIYAIIIFVEIWLLYKKVFSKKIIFLRLIVFMLPLAVMLGATFPGYLNRTSIYDTLLKYLIGGAWHLSITPLSGIGYMFISPNYFHLFGVWDLISFSGYLNFLMSKLVPLIIVLCVVLGYAISKNPKRFIFITLEINFLFLGLIYILATHHTYNFKDFGYDPTTFGSAVHAAIIGSLVFSISISSFVEWWRSERNNLVLLSLALAPVFSLLFIGYTWSVMSFNFIFQGGIHRYLTAPALGASVFLAALICLWFQKKQGRILRVLYIIFFIGFIYYFFVTSQMDIKFLRDEKKMGIDLYAQMSIQDKVFELIKDKPYVVVYFDPRSESKEDRFLKEALVFADTPHWVYARRYYTRNSAEELNGCTGIFYSFDELKKNTFKVGDKVSFNAPSFCFGDKVKTLPERKISAGLAEFYKEELFAFTFKDGKIVDITGEILKKLEGVF